MTANIAVFISGSGTNLQAIIDKVQARELDVNLRLVVSDKLNAYGLVRAHDAGIETVVQEKVKGESRSEYDARLLGTLIGYDLDLIVLSGFMRILTPEFVNHYAGKIINIHPSLLPKYPGLDTHRRAIEAGDKEHGTTVHFVTAELDAGPIIAQSRLQIQAGDDEESLKKRVQELEYDLYWRVISELVG